MGTPISSVGYGPFEVGPIRSMVWIVGCGPGTAEMMADTWGGSRLAIAGGALPGRKVSLREDTWKALCGPPNNGYQEKAF